MARRAGLAALAALAAALLVGLGVWQIERRAWKLELIATTEARLARMPMALPGREAWPRLGPYTRVRLTGRWLSVPPAWVKAVTDLGSGWWMLSPLATAQGVVLVNRGFVPDAERKRLENNKLRSLRVQSRSASLPSRVSISLDTNGEESVVVTGLVRDSEPNGAFLRQNDPAADRWYSRDVTAIAQARRLGPVAPFFVDADRAGEDWPGGGMTVVRFPNNHLVYAITWFALAGLAAAFAWRIARQGSGMKAPLLLPPHAADAGRRNVRLLAVLRWLAVGGQLATILIADRVLHVRLPLVPMVAALLALALLNIIVAQVAARRDMSDRLLFATFLADVAVLTLQLWVSGGVANPFVWLYLLQVVIAAVLLPAWASWTLAGLTAALFAALAASPHALPEHVGERLSAPAIAASWISYALAAGLLVLFVTRIVRNLAERDARLAALRQREAEQAQIVRMGLLASGAAHELGTPLASVAVMLGDWRREAAVARSPELLADVEEMSREVARCKDILGQILLAAGEVRGDRPVRTTLRALVRDTVAAWSGQDVAVTLDDRLAKDAAIVADRPLAQAITTLLDNAAEAGARRVAVSLVMVAGEVTLRIADDGRGFDPAMLAGFGEPYRSTKLRHGAGLGGFLATNVLRTLGGTVSARNRVEGGAEIELRWPLAAIGDSGGDGA